jgi:hypothetical protein
MLWICMSPVLERLVSLSFVEVGHSVSGEF